MELRKTISGLQEALEERTREAAHLNELVVRMEASATNDEVVKTQIEDLRNELANAEGNGKVKLLKLNNKNEKSHSFSATAKQRSEEIQMLKTDLKEREELIQQREIDISCLRGQVKKELDALEGFEVEEGDSDSDSSTLTCDCNEDEVLADELDSEWEM